MENPPTILMFDMDGTLLTTGGAGRRALTRALVEVYGRDDLLAFSMSGLTDRLIVRTALDQGRLPHTETDLDTVLERYLAYLPQEVEQADKYRVLPGVEELLLKLWARRKVALGLGTGNLEAGARTKLERGGLNRFFNFGGFGSDAEDRSALLWTGINRGAERLRLPLDRCSVTIIGDTPKDVSAALELGYRCVGVATGSYDREALLRAGAEAALEDLTAPEALRVVLGLMKTRSWNF